MFFITSSNAVIGTVVTTVLSLYTYTVNMKSVACANNSGFTSAGKLSNRTYFSKKYSLCTIIILIYKELFIAPIKFILIIILFFFITAILNIL